MRPRLIGAAGGILADLVLGEPPLTTHPVAAFGTMMRAVERAVYADSRARGVVHLSVGVAAGVAAGAAVASTPVASYIAIAGRALGEAALEVHRCLVAGDIGRARQLLPALVGRDPSGLGEKSLARAAVESVAENTVDAVVAPALWAAVGGAPGVLGYRAVNTLDAMVGHRNAHHLRYGWASARFDDGANLVPARLAAALVVAVRPRRAGAVVRAVCRDAPSHPSPNAGVVEAAFAAALGLRLGGENRYGDTVELRPSLGDGRPAEPSDIPAAVALCRHVSLALAAGLTMAGVVA
ncbi:MAG: adenosylcobinamide-phosphate synthase CbiB [Actinomycetota bacterium]|jgi:adenosylcobinamide-phosphate synthase|nr:adenosylcobinamide-phosphate synthase CbiB [Actinomycetota bacterium]